MKPFEIRLQIILKTYFPINLMEEDSKKPKGIFSKEMIEIQEIVNYAIKKYKLRAYPIIPTTNTGVGYFKKSKMFGGADNGEKPLVTLRFPKETYMILQELGTPISLFSSFSSEEITKDWYEIPKEIYLNKKLFAKIFKIAYDNI